MKGTSSATIAPQVKAFAHEPISLWFGQTQMAKSILDRLSEDPKTVLWGYAGKFERAAYTDNYAQLSEVLNVLEKTARPRQNLRQNWGDTTD